VPELLVPQRFNGPPGSGNGGYVCGLVAGLLGGGPAEVTLRAPPPIERPLQAELEDGEAVVRDGDTVVAQGLRAAVPVDTGAPVSPADAAEAAAAGLAHWSAGHPFPTCFVCGPERVEGDGMRIFPGALGDSRYAAHWTPHESLADSSGAVRPECVWAALDCPTSAPGANWGEGPAVVLGRLAAALEGEVRAGEPHALVSWRTAHEGRKREAACVLLDASGTALARSRAVWIELRER
jgi:hypothetical protein